MHGGEHGPRAGGAARMTSTRPRAPRAGSVRTGVSADVPAPAAGTLAEAVDWRRRALSATTAPALEPRALSELAARLTPTPGARLHLLRLDAAEAAAAADAARRYLAERETHAYLPPAERTRI